MSFRDQWATLRWKACDECDAKATWKEPATGKVYCDDCLRLRGAIRWAGLEPPAEARLVVLRRAYAGACPRIRPAAPQPAARRPLPVRLKPHRKGPGWLRRSSAKLRVQVVLSL